MGDRLTVANRKKDNKSRQNDDGQSLKLPH
jgi:hypothetical protein